MHTCIVIVVVVRVVECSYHGAHVYSSNSVVFFQAEDGIRYLVRSRGLGDVYKRQSE